MWIRKYLSVVLFILHYLVSILGKALAYIVTPFVFPFRHSIRNYVYNYFLSNNVYLDRCTVTSLFKSQYQTSKGFIKKRKTNKFIAYLAVFLWFFLDDDASLDCCSSSYADPLKIKGLNIRGSYFDLGDKQAENNIKCTLYNFKSFYYWAVIRNGFYNWNYLIEDSILDRTSGIDLPIHERIHESNKNIQPFKYNEFYQDTSGKWFFYLARCWVDKKGRASGFDLGFRRIQPNGNKSNGVNAVARLYWKKKW